MGILEALSYSIPILKLSGRIRKHQKRRALPFFDAFPLTIPEPHPLDTTYKAALFRAQKIARTTWSPAYVVQHKESGKYYADYSMDKPFRPKAGEIIVKKITRDDIRLHGFESLEKVRTWKKTAAIGKRLHKYVDPCMKR